MFRKTGFVGVAAFVFIAISASAPVAGYAASSGIVNGGFETGNLAGWTSVGTTGVSSVMAHSGSFAAMLGSTSPTAGISAISETFIVPSGSPTLSFWYQVHCPDSVRHDGAAAALWDNASRTLSVLLPPTCSNTGSWSQVTADLASRVGHSVTLVLANYDDNQPADPTYTLYDDVTLVQPQSSDFSISASPISVSIQQGSSATSTISTTVTSGSAATVTLSATVSPMGATASLSPTSVSAGGSSTLTVSVGATVAPGSYTLTVTGTEGGTAHSTSVNVTVTAANDFSISASPSSLKVAQGASGISTISTAVTSGSSGPVNLSANVTPAGPTVSLNPSSVQAGGSSTLTISVGADVAPGSYTVTVTGIEGTMTHTTTATVMVTAAADFSISASPGSVSVAQGGGGASTINTAALGAPGTVSFSPAVSPAGPTVSLNPSSVQAGGSSTLTISVGAGVATGSYTFTVTGTEGTVTHTTTVAVTVTAPTGFSISASPGSVSVAQGASGASTINTTVVGAPGTVSLSAAASPVGPTVSLNPSSVPAGLSSTLIITAGTGVAAGGYTITVTGTDGADTHATTVALTVTSTTGGGITNGAFETGTLSGWTTVSGTTGISTKAHSSTYSAKLGSTSPTSGDSSISQTFTVPTQKTQLAFWYQVHCTDSVTYDWATVTLTDNTLNTTILSKTCTDSGSWVLNTASVIAGHSYTLTLTSHDDNYATDPTYTLYDDVTLH